MRCLSQAVVRIQLRVGQLIDSPRQADDLPSPLHAAHRRGGDTCVAQLCQAQNPPFLQRGLRLYALNWRVSCITLLYYLEIGGLLLWAPTALLAPIVVARAFSGRQDYIFAIIMYPCIYQVDI